MADDKKTTSQPSQGRGPLGQSGVSPSGTVQRSYQTEFLAPHRSQTAPPLQTSSPPGRKGQR
jgi:hypothetical protein